MHLSTTARELYEEIARLEIVDGHEHLPTERAYLAQEYSGPNLFAGGYIQHDLRSAGLDPAFVATLRDPGYRPVEDWWPKIRPYWEHVKHTSYARALRVTARDVFGVDDVSDATIGSIAEQVRADNTPGIYARNLRERCRIERVLCISDDPAGLDDETLRGVYPITWIEQRDGARCCGQSRGRTPRRCERWRTRARRSRKRCAKRCARGRWGSRSAWRISGSRTTRRRRRR